MTVDLALFPTRAEAREEVARAYAAFEAAVVEHGPADEWDRAVIRQAIEWFARTGQPYSSNDLRDLLPAVRVALVSRGFITAQRDGLIRKVGYTPSTLESTHGAVVAVYQGVDG